MGDLAYNEVGVQEYPLRSGVISGCQKTTAHAYHRVIRAIETSNISDYYLLNRPKRPKFEIAQYIHSQGFTVPRHFSDIEELLKLPIKDCPTFILRSEHPQDYDGRSGDLPSWEIQRTEGGVFEISFEGSRKYIHGRGIDDIIQSYGEDLRKECIENGIDSGKVSYSVWEYIPGDNYAVVADTGALGRYHIYEKKQSTGKLYKVLDMDKNDTLSPLYKELISEYEKIRNLERFDHKNCPIMEFQYGSNGDNDEKNIYFLQYLRTKNQVTSDWKLERPMELGEIKAQFVRGVTPPEGIIMPFHTKQYRFDSKMMGRSCKYPQDHNEGYVLSSRTASLSRNNNTLNTSIESLVQGYKTICMIIDGASEIIARGDIWKILQNHAGRSFIHKPELSIAINHDDGDFLFPGMDWNKEQTYVRVVSDGYTAYLKRVNVMV